MVMMKTVLDLQLEFLSRRVGFSVNGTNGAANTVATFPSAGVHLERYCHRSGGLTDTDTVVVIVEQELWTTLSGLNSVV